jgi:hypothetical protein
MLGQVIIGLSFYAVGATLRDDSKVVMAGRNCSVGDEWSYSHRRIDTTDFVPQHRLTTEIQKELLGLGFERPMENAISNSVLLYDYLDKCPEKVMLWSELAGVKTINDGFELTFYTISGRQIVHCHQLTDNTAQAISCPEWGRQNITSKRFNTLVYDCGDTFAKIVPLDGITVRPGRNIKEHVVEYTVSPETSLMTSRQQFLDFWLKRPESMRTLQITAFATEFDYDVQYDSYQFAPGWNYLNPLAFKSPLAAFDTGISGGSK